jgi:hypothetical protein
VGCRVWGVGCGVWGCRADGVVDLAKGKVEVRVIILRCILVHKSLEPEVREAGRGGGRQAGRGGGREGGREVRGAGKDVRKQ